MPARKQPFPKARRSASADAALKEEIRRVARMSVSERIEAALEMGRAMAALRRDEKHTS